MAISILFILADFFSLRTEVLAAADLNNNDFSKYLFYLKLAEFKFIFKRFFMIRRTFQKKL